MEDNTMEKLRDLNSHLNLFDDEGSRFKGTEEILKSLHKGKNLYPMFFKKVCELTLS